MKNEVEGQKLTKWEQLKSKAKVIHKLELDFEGEIFPVEVQSVSQATLDAITEKYDDMKKPLPKVFMKDSKKWVECAEDSAEYIDWKKQDKLIESGKMAELALAFLVEKPDGNSTEEQIKELKEFIRPGDFIQIIQAGYEACGFNLDKAIEDGKKS